MSQRDKLDISETKPGGKKSQVGFSDNQVLNFQKKPEESTTLPKQTPSMISNSVLRKLDESVERIPVESTKSSILKKSMIPTPE